MCEEVSFAGRKGEDEERIWGAICHFNSVVNKRSGHRIIE